MKHKENYDFLIVGSGMFGATFARLATDAGYDCLILEKRPHIGGNCYTERVEGIDVHKYGPHIFHCNDKKIWDFVNRFAEFNNFINSPIAISGGEIFSLPFNMYTFYQLWGTTTPEKAQEVIESQKLFLTREPKNLEEQALTLVGTDIYEKLIKNYTKKQWQKNPDQLPPEIIKRIPLRFNWDNNYFNDKYQGIPKNGYTELLKNVMKDIELHLDVDYLASKNEWDKKAKKIIYTGRIDEFYNFQFGELEYRTLNFENQTIEKNNFQGNAVVNYSDFEIPYTRIVEHKHFNLLKSNPDLTIITKEFPGVWNKNKIPYYPIGDEINKNKWRKYKELGKSDSKYIFGGRLAEYIYYDMHQVIASAMKIFGEIQK